MLALKGIATTYGVPFMSPEPSQATVPAPASAKEEPEVSTYDFSGMTLRVVQIDGEPWFVATDVCRHIGFYIKRNGEVNTTKALRYLNDDERLVPPTQIGGRFPTLICESGLYKLIMRSDKPEAKPFQEWVTRDVLPSIRKTGSYSLTDGEDTITIAPTELRLCKFFSIMTVNLKTSRHTRSGLHDTLSSYPHC